MFLRLQGKLLSTNHRKRKLVLPLLNRAKMARRFSSRVIPHSIRPWWRQRTIWCIASGGCVLGVGYGLFSFLRFSRNGYNAQGLSFIPPVNIYQEKNEIIVDMSWLQRTVRLTFRALHLLSLYLPLLFIIAATYLAECAGMEHSMRYAWSYSIWATARAGPIWIKFAQWVATRPDIFPVNLCEQCSQFHSCAPAHSWKESEEMLSKNWPDWSSFLIFEDKIPLGTGCITQVYKATLNLGQESRTVAVKIMHPHVREQMQIDLNLLWNVLKFCARVPILKDYLHWSGVQSSLQEFESMMISQMDLRTEADNLRRFNYNFRDNPLIEFPIPYDDYVMRDILVESFEEGKFISEFFDAPTAVKMRLAKVGLDGFLKMLFEDSFFHDDLHPGNILVQHEGDEYKLIFLDCGIARSFEGDYLMNFLDLFEAIVSRDGERAGKLIYERSPSNDECSNPELFFQDVRELVDQVDVVRLKMSNVGVILGSMAQICVEHKVQLEGNYASVVVAVLVLEGVGRHLNPDLEILKVLTALLVKNACTTLSQDVVRIFELWTGSSFLREWGPF